MYGQTLVRLNKEIDEFFYKELRKKVIIIYARTERAMNRDEIDGPRHDLVSLIDVVLEPSHERFEKLKSENRNRFSKLVRN